MAGYSVTFSVVDEATAQIEAINRRIRAMREPMERQAKALRQFVDLSGLKNVADSFQAIGRAAGDAFASMVRLVPVMGALTGAAAVAGLATLVKGWADFGHQLAVDSTQIGTTSQKLQELQYATMLAGGSASDMTESLKGLTEGLGRAQLGDPQAAAWFRRANIALRDVNGNLRTSTEVLPEVIQYLEGLKNPMDRARAAAGMGSQALAGLAEQYQRSGHSMQFWMDQADKFAPMTDKQQQAVERYNESIGRLNVSLDQLKISIGAALGPKLVPVIDELSNHIDAVGLAATGVAGIFALKWAINIVGAINSVAEAIGVAGVLGVGGVGLLGALGAVVALSIEIYEHWGEIKQAGQDLAKSTENAFGTVKQNLQDWWQGKGGPAPVGVPGYPEQTIPGGVGGAWAPAPIAPGAGPTSFTGDHANFLKKAWPLAQKVSAQTGIDPRLIVAQAALESGWGTKARGQNFFGIKEPGKDTFATYGSMEESFQGYADLMKGGRYLGVRTGATSEDQLKALGTSGYTPDVGYTDRLRAIMNELPLGGPQKTGAIPSQADLKANFAATTGAFGTPEQAAKNLVTVTAPNGATWRVHKNAAAQFQGFINDLYAEDPNLKSGGGYNARRIRGGSGWSAHAFGTAIDINPATNPLGSTATDLPSDVADLASKWGLKWGGSFQGRKDPMHFEIGEPAADVAALNAQGAPRALAGAPGASGTVNVTVTHKNAPPGASVTASSSGDGINLAPPRTEQQQLASVS